jgi:SAM-dependent methyltransferase
MNEYLFHEQLAKLRDHYDALAAEYGDGPKAVQFSDQKTQEQRMKILLEVGEVYQAKILDFGCGTGHLLHYLKQNGFQGEYVGYDLSSAMIDTARRKFPEARFEKRDILQEGIPESFDYVVISGIFNNLVDDNWGMLCVLLKKLFPVARRALAFNILSSYVDYFQPDLYYASPEEVFKLCKEEFSPCVTLRHDYLVKPDSIPFEFTVYVHNCNIAPRRNRQ